MQRFYEGSQSDQKLIGSPQITKNMQGVFKISFPTN